MAGAEATNRVPPRESTESIVIGGGCFWCLDASYRLVPGVVSVECGYSGGRTENPDYREVCTGETGHAEVIRIVYEPAKVSLSRLLELFWQIHDPTTLNRQGMDVGTQYRSVVFFSTPAHRLLVEQSMREASALFPSPLVTEVAPLGKFWRAEEYHQDYFAKNPTQGYCRNVVRAKVEKMRKLVSP